jgi:TPP-dependent trihydroxycyclohexane-1,2-dione (THcHDO) dehydratase
VSGKMPRITIYLDETDFKTALKIMMAESGMASFSELARKVGTKETTFRSAINNNAIRLVDFIKAAEAMGYAVVIKDGRQRKEDL